jgi:DNA-directed RNA polymerase subunit F
MKRYIGRGVGAVAGIPAGPAGIFFGFLMGALYDQYGSSTDGVRQLRRYWARPERERSDDRALALATAILLGLVISGADERTTGLAASLPWPTDDEARPVGKGLQNRRRRHLAGAVSLVAGRPPEGATAVLEDVKRRFENTGSIDRLVDVLVRVAASTGRAVTVRQREVLRFIGTFLDIDDSRLENLERRYRALDTEACRIMGVSPQVDRDELRRVYRRLVANLHPDTSAVLDDYQRQELEEAFLRIRNAYDLLLFQLEQRQGTGA